MLGCASGGGSQFDHKFKKVRDREDIVSVLTCVDVHTSISLERQRVRKEGLLC